MPSGDHVGIEDLIDVRDWQLALDVSRCGVKDGQHRAAAGQRGQRKSPAVRSPGADGVDELEALEMRIDGGCDQLAPDSARSPCRPRPHRANADRDR